MRRISPIVLLVRRADRDFCSATNPRTSRASIDGPRTARGFTLMEILVVLVILAVLAGAVSLALAGAGGERTLAREAERAEALIAYACEQAELGGRTIGISVNQSGYRFSRTEQEVWVPYKDGELRTRHWPAPMNATLRRDETPVPLGDDFPDNPQALCYPSGELTPFRLELGWAEVERRYRLDAKADGALELAAIEAHAR
jgi:general secretion pathway protein H